MANEWKRLCRGLGLVLGEDGVNVRFSEGRKQWVSVTDDEDSYLLASVVLSPNALKQIQGETPEEHAWKWNRVSQLVGFRVDQRRGLVGQARVPKAGLTADEFVAYVRTVAAECDRFEYLLTGCDVE